jgi:hypothetical protein
LWLLAQASKKKKSLPTTTTQKRKSTAEVRIGLCTKVAPQAFPKAPIVTATYLITNAPSSVLLLTTRIVRVPYWCVSPETLHCSDVQEKEEEAGIPRIHPYHNYHHSAKAKSEAEAHSRGSSLFLPTASYVKTQSQGYFVCVAYDQIVS